MDTNHCSRHLAVRHNLLAVRHSLLHLAVRNRLHLLTMQIEFWEDLIILK